MLKKFWSKLFCSHKWRTHTKKKYEWDEESIVSGTELWHQPKFKIQSYGNTVEVLICEHCGRVKKITY